MLFVFIHIQNYQRELRFMNIFYSVGKKPLTSDVKFNNILNACHLYIELSMLDICSLYKCMPIFFLAREENMREIFG